VTSSRPRRLIPVVCPQTRGHHAARQRGAVFATRTSALVELPRHRPARPGGAVFNAARRVASFGIPRPSAMNIAPRWQAAWWRGRSIRRDAGLVLNTARRRQAPPWHPTHRSPDPSVGLTVGLRPRLSATAFPVRQKKLTGLLARPRHPDDGSPCPESALSENLELLSGEFQEQVKQGANF